MELFATCKRYVALTLLVLLEATAVLYVATHPPLDRVDVIYERY